MVVEKRNQRKVHRHYNLTMSENQTSALHYIDSPRELTELSQLLANVSCLSVDTESNSLYVYREQICLIQISIEQDDYLIDTLALHDLSPLASVFANPKQEKIFHAAEYDIICLKRDYNFEIANIFDTMVAARILGEPSVGLASLLQSRLGLTLEKKYQRANWGIRPLSESMLDYARHDSHYLYPLRVILEQDLKEHHLWDLALEDFRLGCEASAHTQLPIPATWWKVAGAAEISPSEAAILQALCDFREEQASRRNLPPFKILSNDVLLYLSKEPPADMADLSSVVGLTPMLIQRYGSAIMNTIKFGQVSDPLFRPNKIRPDDKFLHRLDALKEWRKLKGKELKVESDVILPRDILETIAAENPASSQQLHSIMARIPYRYQHFSKEIFTVLRKQEVS
jgi:ribonuclease D